METWTGGDIHGLRNLAEALQDYARQVRDLAGRLSVTARSLTGDGPGGWQGPASDAFTVAWHRQARSAAALEDYVAAAARVIGELAAELARAGSAAEANAVREAAARKLTTLRQQATAPGPHPGSAMAALLAGGLAVAPASALGRHAAGNTPDSVRAAEQEPEALKGLIGTAEKIPVLDVGATLAGTGVGAYYDIKDGESPATAIPGELVSNGAGMVAADAGGDLADAAIGARLGAVGGPVGVAAGAVIGYGAGDLARNLLDEPWSADIHDHGVVDGTLRGAHHAADQTADDARELAVHAGHQAEHYWDDVFG